VYSDQEIVLRLVALVFAAKGQAVDKAMLAREDQAIFEEIHQG
jgi:hypothetical protein